MSENKTKKIALMGLFFAVLAVGISESITSTTLGLQIVVNNTNMAPFVVGHGGTGERVGDNTTYWNNNSAIEIFLYSHADTSGTASEIHLFINGTKVSDTSGRPLGVAEESNRSVVAIIPQFSFYSVVMVNYHHYEWREYQILTGNVTTNISASSCTVCINQTQLDTKVNKSGDIMVGTLNMSNHDIINNGKSTITTQNTSWINITVDMQRTDMMNYDHIFYIPYNTIGYDIIEQFVNGDINSSNYSYQSFSAVDTTLTGTRDTANAYILAGFIYETSLASGTMSLGADGIFRGSHINSRRNAGNIQFENFAYVYKVPLTSVNSLNYSVVFNRSFAFSNGFGNGTRMTFRRV